MTRSTSATIDIPAATASYFSPSGSLLNTRVSIDRATLPNGRETLREIRYVRGRHRKLKSAAGDSPRLTRRHKPLSLPADESDGVSNTTGPSKLCVSSATLGAVIVSLNQPLAIARG